MPSRRVQADGGDNGQVRIVIDVPEDGAAASPPKPDKPSPAPQP